MATNKTCAGRSRHLRQICVPALFLVLSIAGCKGKRERVTVHNEEEVSPKIAMAVKMGDARAASQLLNGFYSVENNSWRWTAGKFSVMLRPPANAAQAGATLKLAFAAPDVVMQKIGPVTLTASVNGSRVKSEEYKAPGNYTFTADVPGKLLTGDAAKVEFALNKSLPPGATDRRELGLIALSAGFEAK